VRATSPKPELATSEPIRLAEPDLMRSSLDPIRQATLEPEALLPTPFDIRQLIALRHASLLVCAQHLTFPRHGEFYPAKHRKNKSG
jgi:hypothetical protein